MLYPLPAIAANAFTGVTADCYYFADEANGWTAERTVNYGGTLNWFAAPGLATSGKCGDNATWEYDAETRTLDLLDTDTGRVWLRLTVGESADRSEPEEMRSITVFSADDRRPGCTAWYDPQVLKAEKVRYMVSRLTGEGG